MQEENKTPEDSVEDSEEKSKEKLVEENADLSNKLNNFTEEIKEIRKDRTDLKEELNALKEKPVETPKEDDDVESIVNKIITKKEASRAEDNKKKALDEFITNNKQFSDENDPTGLKREALEKKISMFNTSGLTEEKEFISVIKDAVSLLGIDTKSKTHKEEDYNPYSSTPASNPIPTITDDKELTEKEVKLIVDNKWTKERYLKLKENHPDYVESLLG
ncbi:MAG: hypothetical protein GWP19_01500 [Planctomycetia bacterium]|nr:hypothetical protein [Planctomycetia bacterium]